MVRVLFVNLHRIVTLFSKIFVEHNRFQYYSCNCLSYRLVRDQLLLGWRGRWGEWRRWSQQDGPGKFIVHAFFFCCFSCFFKSCIVSLLARLFAYLIWVGSSFSRSLSIFADHISFVCCSSSHHHRTTQSRNLRKRIRISPTLSRMPCQMPLCPLRM